MPCRARFPFAYIIPHVNTYASSDKEHRLVQLFVRTPAQFLLNQNSRGTAAGSRSPTRPSLRGRFPRRASPRLAVPGRRRACRRGSRVAVDSEACTMDGHGDPSVDRGASAPPCRDGTIPAHGRSPWGPAPQIRFTPSVRVISSSIAPTSPIIIDIPPVRLARGGWHR